MVVMFPGQGSQFPGMGELLWGKFPQLVDRADAVLGYSIRELCSDEAGGRLGQTFYTQPALFVVNALSFREYATKNPDPACFVGHSLGELSALYAAGMFDFEQGLRIVAKRAELMSQALPGKMAVVSGLSLFQVRKMLLLEQQADIEIANHNSESQIVLAGPDEALKRIKQPVIERGGQYIPLNVSGAFHSSRMQQAAREFHEFLRSLEFISPRCDVISNFAVEPYSKENVVDCLAMQLSHPVRWYETIRYLQARGQTRFEEVGPKRVLTNLLKRDYADEPQTPVPSPARELSLGNPGFMSRYGLKHPLVAGSMYRGVASVDLVVSMARAGFLSFFGAGGLSLAQVERCLRQIRSALAQEVFGCNLLFCDDEEYERRLVEILGNTGIRVAEVSAYIKPSKALVRYKAAGLSRDANGRWHHANRLIVKLSRIEAAEAFLSPPSPETLDALVSEEGLARDVAQRLASLPVADDLVVEADSAGHTDKGHLSSLLPTVVRLRDRLQAERGYEEHVHVGAAGGIGNPSAGLSAFVLGADFIVTGSINQCTVEAGTSSQVKDILQSLDLNDTAYAPAGDLFEFGAEVQVVKKGTFFPARARKLYELYTYHRSLEEIEPETRELIEKKYFGRSIEEVWREVRAFVAAKGDNPDEVERDAHAKMAAIFKWYFHQTNEYALNGEAKEKVNFQIHCGPSMGSFNRWVRGTEFESWRNRPVADVSRWFVDEVRKLSTGARVAAKTGYAGSA